MDRRVEGADQTFAQACSTGEGASSSGHQASSAEAVGKMDQASGPGVADVSERRWSEEFRASQNEVGLGGTGSG